MAFKFIPTDIQGLILVEPDIFPDARGHFVELFRADRYRDAGITRAFVQDNRSHSKRGVLRGLHYQAGHPQGKLVTVIQGEILDVAVDLRRGSPTFGKHFSCVLSFENRRQLYIPEGFAHGLCALSETADVMYKCTEFYYPNDDFGVRWNDPTLKIAWPLANPTLSPKDAALPLLSEIPEERLPRYCPA